jgi:hypothetical protein
MAGKKVHVPFHPLKKTPQIVLNDDEVHLFNKLREIRMDIEKKKIILHMLFFMI